MPVNDTMRFRFKLGSLIFETESPRCDLSGTFGPFLTDSNSGKPDRRFRVITSEPAVLALPKEKPDHEEPRRLFFGSKAYVLHDREDDTVWLTRPGNADPDGVPVTEILLNVRYLPVWHSGMLLRAMRLPDAVLRHEAFFLHASFIERSGKAVLFSGRSGIGKSTQAALWERYRAAETVNGDRALVIRGTDGLFRAAGSPFAGTSGICKNRTVPLGAVVFLEKADGNEIRPLTPLRRFGRILSGVSYPSWNKELAALASGLASALAEKVPCVCYACLPEQSAVETLERYWDEKGI